MSTPVEPPTSEPPKKRIHGAWYALVALPGLIAIATMAIHIPKLIHGIAEINRKVLVTTSSAELDAKSDMHRVELPAGDNSIEVEGVDVAGSVEAKMELTCRLFDSDGHAVPLERYTGRSTTINSAKFVSQYEMYLDRAGEYSVSCASATPEVPVRYWVGPGFPFLSIVWILLALFLALPMTGVVGYIVHRIRNGKRKGARIT